MTDLAKLDLDQLEAEQVALLKKFIVGCCDLAEFDALEIRDFFTKNLRDRVNRQEAMLFAIEAEIERRIIP